MIQLTPHMKILVAITPIDFRRGIDGMAQNCRQHLEQDPFNGTVFVFRNRRATSIKMLVYDGRGFWLCQKRLSKGRFKFWPGNLQKAASLEPHELVVLLNTGDHEHIQAQPLWRSINNV